MPQRILIIIAWTGICILAACLRLDELSIRPMHADEATGARILAQRLETGEYAFDPVHFHGPLLTAAATPVARMRGERSWEQLNEQGLRLVPVVAGVLVIFTPLLFIRNIGQGGALAAAAFLATSPLEVYFSRMFIHETLLVLTALLALPALLGWLRKPTKGMAILSGVFIGLMWASKETFVITLFAWAVAGLVLLIINGASLKRSVPRYSPGLLLMILSAFAVAAIFYTDFLQRPSGMIDAVRTYFVYETVTGHDKPFLYYFELLLWPKARPGILWWEGLVAILAITSVVHALKASASGDQGQRRNLVIFLAMATILHLLVYSLIAYKTPWLMTLPWAHACLLAGCLFTGYASLPVSGKFVTGALGLACLGLQLNQAVQATGRLETDPRNPYAYVPTSADAVKLGNWLTDLKADLEPGALEPVAVVGSAYWPLPWYLRNFEKIGYWAEPDTAAGDSPVVIVMPNHFDAAEAMLSSTHQGLPRGLRRDTPIMVYIRNDLWKQWMGDPDE